MQKADVIFSEVKTLLLEIPCYERAGTDAEIAEKTAGTVEALKQFDALFAMF
jgi:hypothetical protein